MTSERASVFAFRAPRRTVWVEMPNGTGHWASNWELQQMEDKEAGRG